MNTDKSFGLRVVSELPWYFVGLDLGQSRDYSALAVVERAEIFRDEMDWVTYERRRGRRFRVRYLQRVRLGTPYPDVVAPVLDLLRAAQTACAHRTSHQDCFRSSAVTNTSFMAVAEMRQGALDAKWGPRKRDVLEAYLTDFSVLHSDGLLCSVWAEVRNESGRKGRPISATDAWIAATALVLFRSARDE